MARLRLVPVLIGALAALGAAAGGCGDDPRYAAADGRPTVVATTAFAADLVRGVAGDDADVVQLVPDTASAHGYGASAKDRAALEQADVVVAFGLGYEAGLPLDEARGVRFDIAEHVADHEAHDGHGHDHAGRDPHVWLDPTLLAAAAPGVADALAQADPAHADAYRRRARGHARRLHALDAELRRILAAVPPERRRLATSHESLAYFAERYGFELVGAPFGAAPDAQASARDIARVVDAVGAQSVPVVFAQHGGDAEVMRRIADEAGVRLADDLLVEGPGPGAESYAEAMRHNARRIAEALSR